ncbi:MAG TPA: BPL-N domain-containing protein [Bryobacteraceae bacterium]|nr:BPL-N domain-containing protein [Bryobacteraceae bacterium]
MWRAVLLCLLLTACHRHPDSHAPILLFNGRGASPGDVGAFESLLTRAHLSYTTVDSLDLNSITEADLRSHRLLIIPGGNFIEIGNGLTPAASVNIRNAIHNGLNYAGICAGAFMAGASPPNALNLTGVRFRFYAAEKRGIRKTAVVISTPGEPPLDQYWEDGPQLSGWGEVVSKYPDGTPATVQGAFGSGWVVLTGVHPEAPASWRRDIVFASSVADDNAYATRLIRSALNRTPFPQK